MRLTQWSVVRWMVVVSALLIGLVQLGSIGFAASSPDLRMFVNWGRPASNEAPGARSTIILGVTEASDGAIDDLAIAATLPVGYTNVVVTDPDGWSCRIFPIDPAYGTLVRCRGSLSRGSGALLQLQANAPTRAGTYSIRAQVQQTFAAGDEAHPDDNVALHRVIIQDLKSAAGKKCSITRPEC